MDLKDFLKAFMSSLALSMIFMLGACSQTTIPLASTPDLYKQDKIQAVDHWDTIANVVAMRVQKTLEDRPDLVARPIYIAPPGEGVFLRTFASLLRSRIVSKGMQLSEQQEGHSIILRYNVQTVLHDSSRGDYGLSLAGLGISIGAAVTGGYGNKSDHEVIINSTMASGNRYIMSLSQVCYINDADWELYFDPVSLKQQGESADSIWQRYADRGQAFGSSTRDIKSMERYSDNTRVDKMLSGESNVMDNSRSYSSGYYGADFADSQIPLSPIIEEYQMMPGGKMISPNSPPRPIGRAKR